MAQALPLLLTGQWWAYGSTSIHLVRCSMRYGPSSLEAGRVGCQEAPPGFLSNVLVGLISISGIHFYTSPSISAIRALYVAVRCSQYNKPIGLVSCTEVPSFTHSSIQEAKAAALACSCIQHRYHVLLTVHITTDGHNSSSRVLNGGRLRAGQLCGQIQLLLRQRPNQRLCQLCRLQHSTIVWTIQ